MKAMQLNEANWRMDRWKKDSSLVFCSFFFQVDILHTTHTDYTEYYIW